MSQYVCKSRSHVCHMECIYVVIGVQESRIKTQKYTLGKTLMHVLRPASGDPASSSISTTPPLARPVPRRPGCPPSLGEVLGVLPRRHQDGPGAPPTEEDDIHAWDLKDMVEARKDKRAVWWRLVGDKDVSWEGNC